MNIFRKFLSYLLVFASLSISSGCVGPAPSNTDDSLIIKSHIEMYKNSVDSQNEDIAAILREFSNQTVTNRYPSWEHLSASEDLYMLSLTTNYISSNYTIIASAEEIKISDSFLDMVILNDSYDHPEWIFDVGQRIPYISTKFIIQMSEYQYDERLDK